MSSSVMSKQSLRALVYLGSSSQITVLSSQVRISKTLQNLGTLSTKHLAQSILRQMEWLTVPLKQLSASSRKLTK